MVPTFLASDSMQSFAVVPPAGRAGIDLLQMLSFSDSFFVSGHTPYISTNVYPPLVTLLFAPLLRVPFPVAYGILFFGTLFSYFAVALAFPLLVHPEKGVSGLLMLISATGAFSYGLLFELERGQFNVIAGSCVIASILIFHRLQRYRMLAYALFIVAVQLKLYPFIFLILLVDDRQGWTTSLKRSALLALANFAALFVLGPNVFLQFVAAVSGKVAAPPAWWANHSIQSLVSWLVRFIPIPAREQYLANTILLSAVMLAAVGVCLVLLFRRARVQQSTGIDAYLLLACAIAALLVPSVSYDYKLPLLTGPVALFLQQESLSGASATRVRLTRRTLITLFSLAYSSTLFPAGMKPILLANNAIAILVMLFCVTFSAFFAQQPPAGSRT
jgi:hypothetical protein